MISWRAWLRVAQLRCEMSSCWSVEKNDSAQALPVLIRPGFCAGSKDWSEYGIYGYTSEGGEVSPLL